MIAIQQCVAGHTRKGREAPATIRAFDRAIGAALFLVLLPLLALLAIVIRTISGRSPLVAHLRAGQGGREFTMIKFRTMWPAAGPVRPEDSGWIRQVVSGPVQDLKPRQDPRVTSRFAAFCRTYSLDELPQLWHVARGEMSLVGPRPVTRQELDQYYGEQAPVILGLRPGMSGLWQVLGRNALGYRERRRLDLFLARKYSWRLYLWVLVRTIPRVLSGHGAW